MRILHTSDWHIGRTFHQHSTLEALSGVLDALVAIVRARDIDVVVVSGDVFDSATPAGDCYAVLTRVIRGIRNAGAQVVMTSGNHDSATRLGFLAEFVELAGIHVITRPERLDQPVVLADDHGPVLFYGIPYLEPSAVRHAFAEPGLRTQEQAMTFAMNCVRSDIAVRADADADAPHPRSVVLAHCFAAGVTANAEASDVEREIRVGTLDVVPLSAFDGIDYVALGHIHGRAVLGDAVRYSGAPMHYSFSEANKPRGAWLVTLGPDGLENTEWVDLPVPRPLRVITGELNDLISDDAYAGASDDWISAILTDRTRPIDAMRKLQTRFPHCATLEHRPAVVAERDGLDYAARVRSRSDVEIIATFLEHVRNGDGPTEIEAGLIDDVLAEHRRNEVDA